jgi:ketosteroid isomerase-like protein
MSANLGLVRSIFADWERGDFGSAQWADPQIEWVLADGPAPRSWTGPAGLAEGTRDWLDAWEGYRIEADEYRELDDERVLVLTRYGGRGKTSGLEIGQMRTKGANVFHIRDGRVAKLVQYNDRDHALADLGLIS